MYTPQPPNFPAHYPLPPPQGRWSWREEPPSIRATLLFSDNNLFLFSLFLGKWKWLAEVRVCPTIWRTNYRRYTNEFVPSLGTKKSVTIHLRRPWTRAFLRPMWHHVISVLQTAAPRKYYHVTRIFEPQTKTNGPWKGPEKSPCPRMSEMDSTISWLFIWPNTMQVFVNIFPQASTQRWLY